jgi:phosphatidate cytidylyltransferase
MDIKRIVTGLALIGVVGAIGVIDNLTLTWAFLGVLYLFAFFESLKLYQVENNAIYFWALALWIVAYFYPNPDDLFVIVGVVFASKLAYDKKLDKRLFLPFLYPVSSFLFLFALYKDFGMESLIWLLIIVASADTFAYFGGKAFGKHPFSPTSPKKTIEGVISGVVVASVLGGWYSTMLVELPLGIAISVVVALASVFGDLFESYLKREAGVKDSGNILPGHGGILDRVDGYMFACIVMLIAFRALL